MSASVVCFGELLIRLTAMGGAGLDTLPTLQPFVGGAEANVAVGLARLGHATKMISVIADNELGSAATSELRRWGVDVGAVSRAPGRMGLYFLTPGAIHRPSDIVYDREGSAFATAAFSRLPWKTLLRGADWLHVSGITAALGRNTSQAALKAMQAARSLGVKVAFDCNYRPKLWEAWSGDAPAIIRELMSHADLIFGGHRDIELVFAMAFQGKDGKGDERKAADHAFAQLPHLQRLTTARRTQVSVDHNSLTGLMFTRAHALMTKTCDITGIVDRIGGGDAFAAGIFHGLLSGKDDQTALDYGLACSVLKHAQPGDVSLTTRAQLMGFVNGDGFDVKR